MCDKAEKFEKPELQAAVRRAAARTTAQVAARPVVCKDAGQIAGQSTVHKDAGHSTQGRCDGYCEGCDAQGHRAQGRGFQESTGC